MNNSNRDRSKSRKGNFWGRNGNFWEFLEILGGVLVGPELLRSLFRSISTSQPLSDPTSVWKGQKGGKSSPELKNECPCSFCAKW